MFSAIGSAIGGYFGGPVGGAIGGGIGSMLDAGVDAKRGRDESQLAWDRQQKVLQKGYQWKVKDLRKAGLNPMLAVGSPNFSAPGVQMSNSQDVGRRSTENRLISSQVRKVLQEEKTIKQNEKTGKAQERTLEAQAQYYSAQIAQALSQANYTNQLTQNAALDGILKKVDVDFVKNTDIKQLLKEIGASEGASSAIERILKRTFK